MNSITIKNHLNQEAVCVSGITAFCLVILAIRVKLSHEFYLIFMGWNLFLALLPYALTWFVKQNASLLSHLPRFWKRLFLIGSFCLWLLFLPNAPYMITDFIHLELEAELWWLDFLVFCCYSIAGIYFMYLSIEHWKSIFQIRLRKSKKRLATCTLFFLSAIGVYLGRSLRYNSWDILSDPTSIITDSLKLFINPFDYYFIWMQILSLALILSFGYMVFQKFTNK
ncbi:Uncharacterized membrane protein [Nonlabens sp. Hel1_33_55]|uniref:DUF1361 domain-containing protein n=1 Tax=Nonlabens sp. Hel1_33_55 TaxID=1336802 RepID=UPI000875C3EA|nr:Uncharacterized membrane protein [Nonlabens sp. Hel1_33_55]